MGNRVKKLREVAPVLDENGNWIRDYLSLSMRNRRGREFPYRGRVLRARSGPASALWFVCKSSALLPARVRVPFCISTSTTVAISIGNAIVKTATLEPFEEGVRTLRTLTCNVTRWTEAADATTIRLRVDAGGDADAALILDDEDRPWCRPALRQHGTKAHAITAGLFFTLVWTNLLLLAVIVLAHANDWKTSLRAYAALGVGAMWVAGLLGIPDLAKIPVRSGVRRLFALTSAARGGPIAGARRGLFIAALVVLTAVSGLVMVRIGRVYWVHQRYSSLVRQAWDRRAEPVDPAAVAALKLAPWRREAQMLIERSGNDARTDTTSGYRGPAAILAHEPGVADAVRRSGPVRTPFYLRTPQEGSDPLIWYSTLTIEAESQAEIALVNQAKRMLEQATDPEARLLLDLLTISSLGDDTDKIPHVKRLESSLEKLPDSVRRTHTYLYALDLIAGVYLADCDAESAADFFRRELATRRNVSMSMKADKEAQWLRPPEKFLAYHLFVFTGAMANQRVNPDADGIRTVRALAVDDTKACGPDGFDFRPTFEAIAREFKGLSTREEWIVGTVFHELSAESLEESLGRGWRY